MRKKNETIEELISRFVKKCKETMSIGEKVGEALCEAIRPTIPHIEYAVDFSDYILLTSAEYGRVYSSILNDHYDRENDGGYISLWEIIVEVFPELKNHIITYHIYIGEEEAERVKKDLITLREGKKVGK